MFSSPSAVRPPMLSLLFSAHTSIENVSSLSCLESIRTLAFHSQVQLRSALGQCLQIDLSPSLGMLRIGAISAISLCAGLRGCRAERFILIGAPQTYELAVQAYAVNSSFLRFSVSTSRNRDFNTSGTSEPDELATNATSQA